MDKTELQVAQHALELIAKRHNTTVKMVRAHIQTAILTGMTGSDPDIRAAWDKIPKADEYPTPEEVIIYYAKMFKN